MTNLRCIFLILVLFSLESFGQVDLDKFDALKFRCIGPAGMSGRITAIDAVERNSNIIYIGSASGGVWKSMNGGTTWDPIFDDQKTLSIGAVKINQNNPDEIWVGTGEGNPRNSANSGRGVFKSIDGGKTWTDMGLENTRTIHRIIINPQNSKEVYVGATGSAWGPSKDRGVYKTIDGGKTWNNVLYVNDRTGVADMVQDPNNPNKIIAAMWEYGRTPWDFNSGGEGSGMYITYDGGENWKRLTEDEGMPKGNLGRIGIAIAPSKPNIVYALIEAEENGFYKSTDGGENWKLISTEDIGNRPFYYSEIYVDPSNENRIFNLWSYVSKSEDGGRTFETIMDYGNSVHPDHHAFWIDPNNPSYMINGNDGGLNISRDGGDNWRFVHNIPVGQFYHVAVDDDFPYNVYGGMQDNGSWVGPGFALKSGGVTEADWQELYFGDGFDVAALPYDNRYGYAMSQGGNIGKWDKETGNTEFIKPNVPDSMNQRFNWNAPLALDPFNESGLYYGSQYVHYSPDEGRSWETLSGDLTSNNPDKLHQDKSGGLTIDATNAENHCTLIAIAPSPHDKDVIWVGSDDGRLHITKNGGDTWTELSSRLPGVPKNAWIPQIELSKINKGEAFVVVNNFRQDDWGSYLYHTKDHGATFKRIVNDSQVPSFVCSVVQDAKEENLLFLGTDGGLYVSFDKGKNWNLWKDDLPRVQIRDMKIQDDFDDLVLGTFGRAFWILDDISPLREVAKNNKLLNEDLVLFDPPSVYKSYRKSYQGVRFYAQATFQGADKPYGASIRYWMKPKVKAENVAKEDIKKSKDKKKDKDKKKIAEGAKDVADKEADKVKGKDKKKSKPVMYVFNEQGDTIRTMRPKLKEGMNTVRWRLDQKGVNSPSRRDRDEDREPGNVPVSPGMYKVVLQKGDLKDSCMVEVLRDPRVEMSASEVEKGIAAYTDFNKTIDKAADAFEQLKKSKKTIGLVNKVIKTQEDSIVTEFKSLTDSLTIEIDSLMNLYMDPEGQKGIQRNPKTLTGRLWRARSYLRATEGPPSSNGLILINEVKQQAKDIIRGGNEFFETDWKAFKTRFDELDLKIFEEFEPVEIDGY